jgi:hypothetical protein
MRLNRGETSSVKTGRGVTQGCCLSPSSFHFYSQYFIKETLEGFGELKIGGQIINTLKYAGDLVLLAKEEMVLQDMIDKVIEIGRCCGMEMNVEKNKCNENFKTTISRETYDRPKTTGECGIF